jgi:predicted Fe-Mo cluster-binding NifX family protein
MDAIAAIVASIFVIRAGYETFKDSTKVLLDASIPYENRDHIKEIALNTSGVKKVRWIRARGSGKYFFAEIKIETDPHIDLEKAQLLVEKLKTNIIDQIENIDNVLILLEPEKKDFIRIAAPVEEDNNLDSIIFPHFGEAKYFAIADIKGKSVFELKVIANPYATEPKRKGIMVAEWLGEQQVHRVFVKETLKKGPTVVFNSYFVQVIETNHELLRDIFSEISEKEKES